MKVITLLSGGMDSRLRPPPTTAFPLLTSHFSLLTSLPPSDHAIPTSHFSLLTSHFSLLTSLRPALGHSLGIDFSRTWSCYKGGLTHCGTCGTCVERREAFALANLPDPTTYSHLPPIPPKPARQPRITPDQSPDIDASNSTDYLPYPTHVP